jgi:antirestriction protein ArdC
VLAHELTHSTKHSKRLARDLGRVRHGDEGHAREELVAELGAAFLCADLGLTPEVREDHAAYIATWITGPSASPSSDHGSAHRGSLISSWPRAIPNPLTYQNRHIGRLCSTQVAARREGTTQTDPLHQ